MLVVTREVCYITLIILQYAYFLISHISSPSYTSVSVDERPPASFFLRQANARSEASKRGDCLSEASSSPFSFLPEFCSEVNAALIFSLVLSFASRQKKEYQFTHTLKPHTSYISGILPDKLMFRFRSSGTSCSSGCRGGTFPLPS